MKSIKKKVVEKKEVILEKKEVSRRELDVDHIEITYSDGSKLVMLV